MEKERCGKLSKIRITRVKDILEQKIDLNELDEIPQILCEEWACLQFTPNHEDTDFAAKFGGLVDVC